MINLEEYFNYLGRKAEDRVTGFSGIVTTVSFDLYGCIQVILNPGLDKDGKMGELHWFDINRLKVDFNEDPVMEQPKFDFSFNLIGPESKSIPKN